MQFQKGHIYHVYNQGNNRQEIFFDHENYLFFLRKMKIYILPYADILAWCLMPNHFHFMVLVNELTATVGLPSTVGVAVGTTNARGAPQATPTVRNTPTAGNKLRTFNNSIGIMLRSYTHAINNRYHRSGKLFREKTKAECISCSDGITPSFINTRAGTLIKISRPESEYPDVCFHYIHENPVAAKLVKDATDWEFSSARDYAGMRNGGIVNKAVAKKYILNTK